MVFYFHLLCDFLFFVLLKPTVGVFPLAKLTYLNPKHFYKMNESGISQAIAD